MDLFRFCRVLMFWNVFGWVMKVFLLWILKISFFFCRLLSVWCMVMWLMLKVLFSLFFEGMWLSGG